ncbi:MAG: hypothetical protein E7627_02450 [Ruminococcaceae bacterium]|nr:hypothetical protein [Oscillospiraceae bacterium]
MKTKLISIIIALFCITPLLIFCTMALAADLTDANVKSYQEQIQDVTKKIEAAQKQLESIRSQQSEAWYEIGVLDELIALNVQQKELAQLQLDSLTEQIKTTRESIADTESLIEKQEKAFLDRMAQNYMDEDIDNIELLLNSENLVDFLTRMDRVNAILEYDQKVIKQLSDNKQQLEIIKAKLDESEALQMQRVEEYSKIISEKEAISAEKYSFIQNLEKNEESAYQSYLYYKKLDEQLNKELEEYLAELQRKTQSAYVGGNGGWPLEAGVYYYVSSEQGWRNLWGSQDYHLGIDLACANGTKILAFNAGTVLKSEYHWSYGNYVLIDHGGGISTLYAHMSQCTVQVNQYVQAGQLVGYCGLTGSTSGYHLHFEVRENGSVVNPRNYLVFP